MASTTLTSRATQTALKAKSEPGACLGLRVLVEVLKIIYHRFFLVLRRNKFCLSVSYHVID